MVGSFVANMIQGFASEKLRMGDEGRAALAAQKEAEAQEKMEAMKIVATHLNDADFIKSGQVNTPYFLNMIEKSGQDKDTVMKSITQLANNMADVNSTLDYGDIKIPKFGGAKLFDKNMLSSDGTVRGQTWFNSMATHFDTNEKQDNFVRHLQQNPALGDKFIREAMKASVDYNVGEELKSKNTITGESTKYIPARKKFQGVFRIINQFKKGMDSENEQDAAVNIAKMNGEIENVQFSYKLTGDDGNAVVTELPERLHKYLPQLANFSPRFNGNVKLMLNELATIVPQDGDGTLTGYRLNKVLYKSLEMMDAKHDIVVNGGGSLQDRIAFGQYLNENFKNDRYSMAQAVSLMLKPKDSDENSLESMYEKSETLIAKDFFDLTGFKLNEVREQRNAGVKLQGQLANFAAGTFESGTTGFARQIQNLGIRIFGQGGQIDQVFGKDMQTELGSKFKEGTTVKSLEERAKALGFFSEERGSAAAKAEAAQVALAIAMARAADPAGRLSNQDFEVQLARLGAAGIVGSTMPQVVQKLRDISIEFARDLDRVKVMVDVAKPGELSKPRNIRMLRADYLIQTSLDEAYLNESMNKASDRNERDKLTAIPENFPRTNRPDGTPKRTLNGQRVEYYEGQWYREDTENNAIVPLDENEKNELFKEKTSLPSSTANTSPMAV